MLEIPFLDGSGLFVNTEHLPWFDSWLAGICGWPWIPVLSLMVLQLQTGSRSTGHKKAFFLIVLISVSYICFLFPSHWLFLFLSLVWIYIVSDFKKKKRERETFLYSVKLKVHDYLFDSGSWGNVVWEGGLRASAKGSCLTMQMGAAGDGWAHGGRSYWI